MFGHAYGVFCGASNLKVQASYNIKNLDVEQTYQKLMENASGARVNLTQKGLIEAGFHGKNDAVMLISRKGNIQITFDYRGPVKSRRFLKRLQTFLIAIPNKELRESGMRFSILTPTRIMNGTEDEPALSFVDILQSIESF
jgi:hypothetical protein